MKSREQISDEAAERAFTLLKTVSGGPDRRPSCSHAGESSGEGGPLMIKAVGPCRREPGRVLCGPSSRVLTLGMLYGAEGNLAARRPCRVLPAVIRFLPDFEKAFAAATARRSSMRT